MNPNVENQYKLDSAMKRRFVLVDVNPDYSLLALHLDVSNYMKALDIEQLYEFSSNDIKCLAIQVLKELNDSIAVCLGSNYQIGHSVFWDIPEECTVTDIIKVIDLIIMPQIEEYCYDEDIAKRMFGNTPAITVHPYGVELHTFGSMNQEEVISAFKGILGND